MDILLSFIYCLTILDDPQVINFELQCKQHCCLAIVILKIQADERVRDTLRCFVDPVARLESKVSSLASRVLDQCRVSSVQNFLSFQETILSLLDVDHGTLSNM